MAKKQGYRFRYVLHIRTSGSGRVSYTEPYVANSAVEYGVDIEANEDNNLYADNKVKETAGGSFFQAERFR